jgi:hypothetical protein
MKYGYAALFLTFGSASFYMETACGDQRSVEHKLQKSLMQLKIQEELRQKTYNELKTSFPNCDIEKACSSEYKNYRCAQNHLETIYKNPEMQLIMIQNAYAASKILTNRLEEVKKNQEPPRYSKFLRLFF